MPARWSTGSDCNAPKTAVDWVPYLADGDSGIGRQITVQDVNGDKLPDLVVGGMKGSHVLLHERQKVDEAEWKKHQPKRVESVPAPGASVPRDDLFEGNRSRSPNSPVATLANKGWMVLRRTNGAATRNFGGRVENLARGWSLEFPVAEEGEYDLALALTKAVDYGIVKIDVDGNVLAEKIDLLQRSRCRSPRAASPTRNKSSRREKHKLGFEIVGANDKAVEGLHGWHRSTYNWAHGWRVAQVGRRQGAQSRF